MKKLQLIPNAIVNTNVLVYVKIGLSTHGLRSN